jgi:hypothetical protein
MKAVSANQGIRQRLLRIGGTAVLAATLAGAMSAAWAQPGRGGDRGPGERGPQQTQPGEMGRRGDMQGMQGMQGMHDREQMRRGMARELSPEEREQLRRDIRDHGRDVYGDRDQRRRNGPPR